MENKEKMSKIIVKLFIIMVSLVGFIFLLNYIYNSSIDLILSDYIRIVNNYLENVFDFKYLFSIEFITRVPITYLMRIINVIFFKYSVFFDKIIGIIFLTLFNIMICNYVSNKISNYVLKIFSILSISLISFSLVQWEMILNGTGYPHYMTIFLITVIFYICDKYFGSISYGKSSMNEKNGFILLLFTIVATSFIFAGSYQVAYLSSIFIFSIAYSFYIKGKKISIVSDKSIIKRNICIMTECVLCIILYYISSNSGEVLSPVGFKDVSLIQLLITDIKFPIKFLLNSLSSSIIGVETIEVYKNLLFAGNNKFIYIISIIYIIVILTTIFLYFKFKLKLKLKYIFLELMFFTGCVNYALVFLARFKFLDVSYGMSSRYGIQYMFLSISIISILFIIIDKFVAKNNIKIKSVLCALILIIPIIFINSGNIITTKDELNKMVARKMYYINAENVALNIENYSDEDLKNVFEYRRSAESIKMAFKILKDKKYNIYK